MITLNFTRERIKSSRLDADLFVKVCFEICMQLMDKTEVKVALLFYWDANSILENQRERLLSDWLTIRVLALIEDVAEFDDVEAALERTKLDEDLDKIATDLNEYCADLFIFMEEES